MEKLSLKTKDLTAENIAKLSALFPEIITEVEKDGKTIKTINADKLKELIGDYADNSNEVYELNWVGKQKSRQKIVMPINKTLRPVVEDSVDFENTENLYIEGDNFEVLKLLQESYLNKVKIIYIDPPYNTGKDFVYKDNFAMSRKEYDDETGAIDEEGNKLFLNTTTNGRFHSDWLSMMYERLVIAKDLLRDDGGIFVSIDDNEVANLRKICDEVFGESNFRNIFATRRYDKNLNRQFMVNGLKTFNVGFEYILCYSKSTDFSFEPIFKESSEERQKSGYWKGFWNDADRPTMRYDILGYTPDKGQWKWKKDTALEAVKNYEVYIDNYKEKISLEEYWESTGKDKKFIRRNLKGKGKNCGVENWIPPSTGILRNTNWTDLFASKPDDTSQGLFDYPKNKEVIGILINSSTQESNIILDFFSGSATTAHAVMQLNAEDGGNRKYIMVQLPEQTSEDSEAFKAGYGNICEIGKERIRRAAKKIQEDNTDKDLSNVDFGFRVFKLDSSNMKDVYYNPNDIDQRTLSNFKDNIKEDRNDKDLLYQVLLEMGLPISGKVNEETVNNKTIYRLNDNFLIACFDDDVDLETTKEITELKPLILVFKDSSFKDDAAKVNCHEYLKNKIPATIVKVI